MNEDVHDEQMKNDDGCDVAIRDCTIEDIHKVPKSSRSTQSLT